MARRCSWCNPHNPLYIAYHDTEWGVPLHDDTRLFELFVLETFQSGLSWECVLNKREAFRKAFSGFSPEAVAQYGEKEVQALLSNAGIIRNKLKIKAAIHNAKVFLEIQKAFGSFDKYLWGFTHGETLYETGRVSSPLSDAVSRDMKRRGFKQIGTVTAYSFLQAAGLVNSHDAGCFLYSSQESDSAR